MNHRLQEVSVIIRSVGERTEEACRRLILAEGVDPRQIAVVREAPFSLAMRRAFETGQEMGLPWTFCIDADVLLRPGAIEKMLQYAGAQADNVCEIQGYVLCKLFGGPRTAGNHLYRTSLLSRVLENIPAEGIDVRPEFHTLELMKAQGFPWVSVPYVVGLHDFEQYHRDTMRKCFVQAHKHLYLAEMFLTIWRDGAAADSDYRCALAGFARGIEYTGSVRIDVREPLFDASLKEIGLAEKTDLDAEAWSLEAVEATLRDWKIPQPFASLFPDRAAFTAWAADLPLTAPAQTMAQRLASQRAELGWLRFIPYFLGVCLSRVSRLLEQWARR